MRNSSPMTRNERRATFGLAGIYASRMLGLFLILPVFTLYAPELDGYTPALAGLAIGVYGLTQAVLQIPFGMLSDRIGRRRVIAAGLLLFIAGSVVAALSTTIGGVIVGRALQGAGAIAAAVMAMAADLTREDQRTKAMALIGMAIGMAFMSSMVLGPLLGHWLGLSGLFWSTAGLAGLALVLLLVVVPTPERSRVHRDAEPVAGHFRGVLTDPQLLRLDFGILVLHLIMTATFLALPLLMVNKAGLQADSHYLMYLTVMLGSVAIMVPFIILSERYGQLKRVFAGAVLAIAVAHWGLGRLPETTLQIGLWMLLYFTAFNILEASLPSLVSRVVHPDRKGTAMGIYSTSQFFGAFIGGSTGGWMLSEFGLAGVFSLCMAAALVWFAVALGMRPPQRMSNRLIKVGMVGPDQATLLGRRMAGVAGVVEAVVVPEDGVAYLKVDPALLDQAALDAAVAGID